MLGAAHKLCRKDLVGNDGNPRAHALRKLCFDKQSEYAMATNRLEPDILIGREFMENFTYLTFVHEKDPAKSYFEYELRLTE